MKSKIETTPATSAATASKYKPVWKALLSPAIRKGVTAAAVTVMSKGGGTVDLNDYLTTRQMNRLDREAVANGFSGMVDYLEDFISKCITALMEHLKATDTGGATA